MALLNLVNPAERFDWNSHIGEAWISFRQNTQRQISDAISQKFILKYKQSSLMF
jgi:hypothetical protein